jgi:acetolactate synthase small subunit
MMGPKNSVNDFIIMIKPFGVKEIVRSGIIAIAQHRK